MQKNVAGQKIGAQLVSSADGSAFTAAVTVAVTGDAGTQAAGSVGSGACTHEGNGYHTYAPSQAETNFDLVAFTFTGTGAVPATVQIFTAVSLVGDLTATMKASVNAEADTALADYDAPTHAEMTAELATADDAVLAQVALVKAKTDNLPADPADASDIAAAFSTVNTNVDTAEFNIMERLGAPATTNIAGDIGAVQTKLGAPAGVSMSADIAAIPTTKTDYKLASDGLDSVATTAPAGVASNFREMLVQTWRRWFKKTHYDISNNTLKTYADNGTSVLTTQATTVSATDEDVGAAS